MSAYGYCVALDVDETSVYVWVAHKCGASLEMKKVTFNMFEPSQEVEVIKKNGSSYKWWANL